MQISDSWLKIETVKAVLETALTVDIAVFKGNGLLTAQVLWRAHTVTTPTFSDSAKK